MSAGWWSRYRAQIARSRVPALVSVVAWGLLAAGLLRLWWGHPSTVRAINTHTGSFLLEALYFSGLYLLLSAYSRTLSVRQAVRWFSVGLVGVTVAFALLHSGIYAAGSSVGSHPLLGRWKDPYSLYHTGIFSPLLSEGLKTVPLLIFLGMARRRGTLHTYAITDWALMGFLVGIGFHVAENAIRVQHALYGVDFSWPQRSWDLVLPLWRSTKTIELFGRPFTLIGGSHGVQSGLIGMALGAAVFLRRRGGPAAVWFLPPLAVLWTMLDHALFNLVSDAGSPLLAQGWVRALYLITAGGRVQVYGFGFGMAALAAVECRLLHRRWNPAYPAGVARQVGAVLRIVWATLAGTTAAVRRVVRERRSWRLPVRVLAALVANLLFGTAVLLEYLNAQWAQARVRHAVAWHRLATVGPGRAPEGP